VNAYPSADLIQKLIRERVFVKTDTPGSLPRVYVGPAFYGLDFDTKQQFVSVVYAYYFDGSNASGAKLYHSSPTESAPMFFRTRV
jgi:hypothetical protein